MGGGLQLGLIQAVVPTVAIEHMFDYSEQVTTVASRRIRHRSHSLVILPGLVRVDSVADERLLVDHASWRHDRADVLLGGESGGVEYPDLDLLATARGAPRDTGGLVGHQVIGDLVVSAGGQPVGVPGV